MAYNVILACILPRILMAMSPNELIEKYAGTAFNVSSSIVETYANGRNPSGTFPITIVSFINVISDVDFSSNIVTVLPFFLKKILLIYLSGVTSAIFRDKLLFI